MLSIEEATDGAVHNLASIAEDEDRGSFGSCHHPPVHHWVPQPSRDACAAHLTCFYAETTSLNRAANIPQKIPYATEIRLVSFNTCSLLKPAMHVEIIQHMKQHSIHV